MEENCEYSSQDDSNPADQTLNDRSSFAFYKDVLLNDFVSFSGESKNRDQVLSTNDEERTNDFCQSQNENQIEQETKKPFPKHIGQPFSVVEETLRNERRDEFAPIYKDEAAEETRSNQLKRKQTIPVPTKRARLNEPQRKYQQQTLSHYGPYGPVYVNQRDIHFDRSMPNSRSQIRQPTSHSYNQVCVHGETSFSSLIKTNILLRSKTNYIERVKQENSGFWPESEQLTTNHNHFETSSYYNPQFRPTNPHQIRPYRRNIPDTNYYRPHQYFPQ